MQDGGAESIYDAHHHLWDLEAVHYPWLAARGVKRFFGDPTPIQKNYLPEDLLDDIGELPIRKSVHIQVGAADDQHLAEAEWVQKMADTSPLPSAMVAFCALESAERSHRLDQLEKFPALRGVRQIVGRAPEEDRHSGSAQLLDNPAWLRGLHELQGRGLRFDLQLIPELMQKSFSVFRQVDELPVALCHAGSPWYREREGWALWRKGLCDLASLPRTVCKISGLGMFDHDWTVETLRPVVETVIDTFGPERCMLGSNFPVDKLYTDYQRLWQAYLELIAQYSAHEQAALKRECCANFYVI